MESRLVAVNDCCLYNQAMRNPSALRTLSSQTDETVEHRHVQQSPYTIRYRMGRYQATIFCHLNKSLQPYKYFSNYDVKLSCQIEGPSETIIHLSFNNRWIERKYILATYLDKFISSSRHNHIFEYVDRSNVGWVAICLFKLQSPCGSPPNENGSISKPNGLKHSNSK